MIEDFDASLRDRAAGLRPQPPAASSQSSIPSAEPLILVSAADPNKTPLLYACAGCGSVHSPAIYLATKERAHEAAMEAARDCYNCKTHNICKHCGAQCSKGSLACAPCWFQHRLDAATEIPDDGGPYCAFDGDTYFTEMEEATDEGLEWVSPCEITYPQIDGESVLESLLDDMHEDASVDDLDGVDAFLAAVKVFNDAQRCRSWWGDVKRKIRVPASAMSGFAQDAQRLGSAGAPARSEGDAQ